MTIFLLHLLQHPPCKFLIVPGIWQHHAETESTLILPDFTLNVLAVKNYQTD
jgi:hypothetical protein